MSDLHYIYTRMLLLSVRDTLTFYLLCMLLISMLVPFSAFLFTMIVAVMLFCVF